MAGDGHPICVVVGHGRTTVPQAEFRAAPSRAVFRATVAPTAVPAHDGALSAKLIHLAGPPSFDPHFRGREVTIRSARQLSLEPFRFRLVEGEAYVEFTGFRAPPSRSARPLGTLDVDECIEVAVNHRSMYDGQETQYVDLVWRIERVPTIEPGVHEFREPTRVVDLRKPLF